MNDQDRFLVERSEEAIRDGGQLFQWCFDHVEKMPRVPLDLGKRYRLPNIQEAFFGELSINGQPTSVMGTRQQSEFGRIEGSGAGGRLRAFVHREFLERGYFTHPDGQPGGFEFHRTVFQDPSGAYGTFEGVGRNGAIDWNDLPSRFRWVLLRVDIHDFVMEMGPFKKKLKEAACVVAHPAFTRTIIDPEPGYELEVTVGYPFAKFAPIPNIFGFGPGKFDTAVKTYSFLLTPTQDVHVRMYFAAAPRCQRVFDFGPSAPDPVYGGARLLRKLSFGKFDEDAFHRKLDSGMLIQHCRVHQSFIEGAEKAFKEWLSK